MDKLTAEIAVVCECIDQCFSYSVWCQDFAQNVDPEDMVWGLDRGHQLVSDATRLMSFLALRKIDEFLREHSKHEDDIILSKLGIDRGVVLSTAAGPFLTREERLEINRKAAHLTSWLTFDDDSEIDLIGISRRSLPMFEVLIHKMQAQDKSAEAAFWLDRSRNLLLRMSSNP